MRQDSSLPLLDNQTREPTLSTSEKTMVASNLGKEDNTPQKHSIYKHKKLIGCLVIGLLLGSATAASVTVLSIHQTDKSTSNETKLSRRKTEFVKEYNFEPIPYSHAPRVLVFLGGERAGYMTDIVEVSPFGSSTSCAALPPLPEKLKWGSAGFVSGNLIVCGGETERHNPSCRCWVLGGKGERWQKLGNLTR